MTNSTALVTIDEMPAAEARMLHMEVKNRGRGEVSKFIKYETAHTSNQYYYRLRKKGVMPVASPRTNNKNSVVGLKPSRAVSTQVQELEIKIAQLELALKTAGVTPASRALAVLNSNMDELGYRSRSFLSSLIGKNIRQLTEKQETWLSNLERKVV